MEIIHQVWRKQQFPLGAPLGKHILYNNPHAYALGQKMGLSAILKLELYPVVDPGGS